MNNIILINPENKEKLLEKDSFLLGESGKKFPIINNIPRFVSQDNYTKNFGFQWNKFKETQLKKNMLGEDLNFKRFFAETSWSKKDLDDSNILEVGSGAGRFTRVVLEHSKAFLFSIDSSSSVDANLNNNKGYQNRLNLFQADIASLPFENHSFDKIFCLGVLQHTSDYKVSLNEMLKKLKKGGEIVVDFYPYKGFFTKIHAKYFFRNFTKNLKHETLLSLIENHIGKVRKVYNILDKLKLHLLTRFLPICDIKKTIPKNIDEKTLSEWIVLDTFDMYSPEHDHPQTLKEVRSWFDDEEFKNVEVWYGDNGVVAKADKRI